MRDKYSEGAASASSTTRAWLPTTSIVKTYVGLDTPFDVKTAYTNEFLDRSIKMPK